jgi:hypothetical protein
MMAAIDAGGRKTTGWATSTGKDGQNLEELARVIRGQLKTSRVVLAVEAPLWIPLREHQSTMTAVRAGERLSWAGRVGGAALAAGLANVSVILTIAKPNRVMFDETNEPGTLVFLEAYRPSARATNIEVAHDILNALVARWPNQFVCRVTRRGEENVLNLVAAAALALGIVVAQSDLRRETKVIDPSALDSAW